MSEKLIVVSNRIPTGDAPSGGLVVALHDALEEHRGIWIGAHPDRDDTTDVPFIEVGTEPYTRLGFRISEAEYQTYYLGFANSVLWPVCHRRGDLVDLSRDYEEGYHAVNARLAARIAELAGPDDLIWVHDYHFFPLARELRNLGVTARIGFFLHIPFPALGDLGALSERADMPGWLAAYDLVGLQTRADVARCLELFRSTDGAEMMLDGEIKMGERTVAVRSFPIGIDVESFAAAARAPLASGTLGADMAGDILIGVDRLDYSKGLPNRFRAFGQYLETREDHDRRVSFLQIAPPTREEVSAYQDIRAELEEIAGRLNGEHSELDWTPLRYIHRAIDRELLAQLYRRAQAALVTPFADGMNLVAKEYVAAQDARDPGVLILSRMAGAAEDLTEALLINPYDVDEISEAIALALDMPLAERRERHAACLDAVRKTDVTVWSRDFLKSLRGRGGDLPFDLTRLQPQDA